MRSKNNPKIVIEFTSPEAALEWFDAAKEQGFFPEGSDLYNADGLDVGRASPYTYVVRDIKDKLLGSAVRSTVVARSRTS